MSRVKLATRPANAGAPCGDDLDAQEAAAKAVAEDLVETFMAGQRVLERLIHRAELVESKTGGNQ